MILLSTKKSTAGVDKKKGFTQLHKQGATTTR